MEVRRGANMKFQCEPAMRSASNAAEAEHLAAATYEAQSSRSEALTERALQFRLKRRSCGSLGHQAAARWRIAGKWPAMRRQARHHECRAGDWVISVGVL